MAAEIQERLGQTPADSQDQCSTPSDRELLLRFARRRDEAAFHMLVQRHGPLILGICQRVLHNRHDAEDVSQAVFLVLARKAASVRWQRSVGNFAAKVAYRLASEAKKSAQRRQTLENQAEPPGAVDPWADISLRDAAAVLNEEISRLPEGLRLPVVLYYMDGQTRAEVAPMVGCSIKTLDRRLERARELLRGRLTRRGIALSPLLLICVLEKCTAKMPAEWVASTVQAAVSFTTRHSTAQSACRSALWAEKVLQAMFMTQVKLASVMVVAAIGLAAGGVLAHKVFKKAVEMPQAEAAMNPSLSKDRAAQVDLYGDPLPLGAVARLGSVRFRHGHNGLASFTFTPDGKALLVGSEGYCQLLDAVTGKPLRRFGNPSQGSLRAGVQLSPDGHLVAGRVSDENKKRGCLCLWETASGKLVRQFADQRDAYGNLCCAFSPDSKTIVAQCGDDIVLWEIDSGRQIWTQKDPDFHDNYRLFGKDEDGKDTSIASTAVKILAFSPNGETIVSSVLASEKEKGGIRLWDARNGRLLRKFDHPWQVTHGMAFSRDGGSLLVGCTKLRVRNSDAKGDRGPTCSPFCFMDAATGKEIRYLGGPNNEGDIATPTLSPSGKVVAVHARKGICLWDAATGRELHRCENSIGFRTPLAFSPNGKIIAALSRPVIRYWDAATGKALPLPLLQGHENGIASVAFADNDTLISGGDDISVRVWDAQTGRERLKLPAASNSYCDMGLYGLSAAVHPDGKLAAGEWVDKFEENEENMRMSIRLWDVKTGREFSRLQTPRGALVHPVFAPNGKILAAVRATQFSTMICQWDLAAGKLLHRKFPGEKPLFLPDGVLLALTEEENYPENRVDFWEVATGEKFASVSSPKNTHIYLDSVAVSPDGRLLAMSARSEAALNGMGFPAIYLYPVHRSNPLKTRLGTPRVVTCSVVSSFRRLAFSPDGKMLAACGHYMSGEWNRRNAYVWETVSGKERACFQGHDDVARCVAFSPDCRRLASGCDDSTILIWDVTGRLDHGRLQPVQLSATTMDKRWADLADGDAERANRAVWALTAAGSSTVSFLAAHLQPLLLVPAAKTIQAIADLDAEAFTVRQQARQKLSSWGERVESSLREGLAKKPSIENRRVLQQLLEEIENKRGFLPAGEELRSLRALEVLEHIGAPQARRVLETVSQGAPGVRQTEEAKACLVRLSRHNAQKP